MKKIIFLVLISLLVTGSVLAFRPAPAPTPVPTPVPTPTPLPTPIEKIEKEEVERIKEIITEVQKIDREIKEKIETGAREIKERIREDEGRTIDDIEIRGLIEKTEEVKVLERKIEEGRGSQEIAEERVASIEKEIVALEKVKPEAIQREIEKAGIDIALIDFREVEQGIGNFRQDKQEELSEVKRDREEIRKELEGAIQKRDRIREDRQRQAREIGTQAVPLIEEIERVVTEKREEQLIKIAEIRRDGDNDGLSDEEEIRLGTNPFNSDTDNDGFLDGIEVRHGFNPLDLRREVEFVIQDPREVAPRKIDVYIVENVEIIILLDGRRGIEISGRGLPNSLVTLFIFSEPIIVAVRTDREGRWSYVIEDPQDGKHEVYVAITNNRGEIEARSLVLPFVLAGANVAVIPHIAKVAALPTEELLKRDYLIAVLIVVVLGIIAGLFVIKFFAKKKEEKANI